jgi:hypothetical protein
MDKYTVTLTFGEQSENHVGMQKIGNEVNQGLTVNDLLKAKEFFDDKGCDCTLMNLAELGLDPRLKDIKSAYILVVKDAVNVFANYNSVLNEQKNLNHDKKAFMYGRVVNKTARYNLCFDEYDQEPDYENKKGRIVSYQSVPFTNRIRENLHIPFGSKAKNLTCEGNYYYDNTQCGIGYHGDSERKIVIAIRLGSKMPLCYQWYKNGSTVGEKIPITLSGGDLYAMTEKATGNDWKSKKIYTLRHAAGSNKYTKCDF